MPTLHSESFASSPQQTGQAPNSNSSRPHHMPALYRFSKAVFDYALTTPALVLLSPLYLLIAVLIKLESPGPVLSRRRVMGLNGREFDVLRFRTTNAPGSSCLTRIGQLLHRYNLDDLPQMFNVLRRDMSVVGPRMITPPEVAMYGRYREARLTVYPGLTGLWQINARNVTREERIRLDLTYVREWSVWLDLKILFLSIPAALKS